MLHSLTGMLRVALFLGTAASPVPDIYVDGSAVNCAAGTGTLIDPVCSIGSAIALAAPGDTVRIAPGTYFENLVIGSDLELVGTGGADVTIVHGGIGLSVIEVQSAVTATIGGLTLTRSDTGSDNGLTVNSGASVMLQDSTVTSSGPSGIRVISGTITLADCEVRDNRRRGIEASNSDVTIANTTISSNGPPSVFPSIFGRGGGITTSGGTLAVMSSTISGNRSAEGAGAFCDGTDFVFSNTTISGNAAFNVGGLWSRNGPPSNLLLNVTITQNTSNYSAQFGHACQAAGLYSNRTLGIRNTIVAGNTLNGLPNTSYDTPFDVDGLVTLLTNNLIGVRNANTYYSCYTYGGYSGNLNGQAGNIVGVDARLGPLRLNGGSTATHSLLEGSPAIDAGDPLDFESLDQRGRPRPIGLAPDMGAFELDEFDNVGGDLSCNGDRTYFKASNTDTQDRFGEAIAMSGDTLVVGARFEDSGATGVDGDQSNNVSAAGAAYVFVRSSSGWVQQAYLKASNAGASDGFGLSVAISGETIVIGANLEDSGARGVGGDQLNEDAPNSGAAYVFVRNGSVWSQQAYLKASNSDAGDLFGSEVAVSGDTLVVSSRNEDSIATGVDGTESDNAASNSGAAYVFVRTSTTWSQQAYIKASNTEADDLFGGALGIYGDTIVVVGSSEDSVATGIGGDESNNAAAGSGAAYVFVRTGSTWSQEAYIKASNTELGDGFGSAVGISVDTLVVGAWNEDSAATGVDGDETSNTFTGSGAAYIFVRTGSTWSQEAYLKASNVGFGDRFGSSVSIAAEMVMVGAPAEDGAANELDGDQTSNAATDSGASYLFERNGPSWSQRFYVKPPNTGSGDAFGTSAVISGQLLAVGSPREDGGAMGLGGDTASDTSESAGAAYVFDLDAIAQAVGTSLCSGDGGDQMGCANCPCNNNVIPGTIGGCVNGVGSFACLSASGSLSASLPPMSTTDLRFSLVGIRPASFSVLVSGSAVAPANPMSPCSGTNAGVQSALFNGLRCAVAGIRRHGGRSADSNGSIGLTNNPWGGEGGPSKGIARAGTGFVAGQTRYFQSIYRDNLLLVCMRGLNTSQAIELTFEP